MKIEFKKLNPKAPTPEFKTIGSVGVDLTALEYIETVGCTHVFSTGLEFDFPVGYYGEVYPRSSNFKNLPEGCFISQVSIIDQDYQGEVVLLVRDDKIQHLNLFFKKENKALVERISDRIMMVKLNVTGQRIAQLIIKKRTEAEFCEVHEFKTNSERGGLGSTGK